MQEDVEFCDLKEIKAIDQQQLWNFWANI